MEEIDYLKRRDELLKIRDDSFNSFDKAILTLSTGGLALSITFLEKIGSPFNGLTFSLILIFWICLFLIICLNLISFFYAIKNMDYKIDELNFNYKNNKNNDKNSDYKNKVIFCNKVILILFVGSFIIFVVYISLIQYNNYNKLKRSNVMTNKNIEGKVLTEGKVEASIVYTKAKVEAPQAVQANTSVNTNTNNSSQSTQNSGEKEK